MIVIFESGCDEKLILNAKSRLEKSGLSVFRHDGHGQAILAAIGDASSLEIGALRLMPGVREIVELDSPYKLAGRQFHPEDTRVNVGGVMIGGPEVVFIAGPCAVENAEQVLGAAAAAAAGGARILRGGAFKPRTSPYHFQGLGEEGLQILRKAADRFSLPVVSEVMTIEQIGVVGRYTDMLQVGARSMHNYALLTALGRCGKPVLLKRGFAATINEWLMSAEYILAAGNPDVVLCERGIRTFESKTRCTLDISAVPVVKSLSHLPIIVDPSHSAGDWRFVASLARASVAAGADGVMTEIHPDPAQSFSDATQALTPDQFNEMMDECRKIAAAVNRTMADRSA